MDALNAYLANNSYLGSDIGITLEDYKRFDEIKEGSFDAAVLPNLNRWYNHVSALKSKYPKFDHLGNAISKGTSPDLGGAPKKETAPKKENAPKKDNAPKKENAPKEEAAPKKGSPKASAKKAAKAPKEAAPKVEAAPPADDAAAAKKAKEAKLKKVIKEGGKRGVEIEGSADMGGLQFFSTSVDEPEGDEELLLESLKAMNEQAIPGDEERKGCSGHVGKTIFSAGTEQLAIIAYVPEAKQGELSCEEWLKNTLSIFQGEILTTGKDICTGRVKADGDKGIFPLKIREAMILEANKFLRKRGLFPEDNDSDDDEMVFGDDDFPS